MIPTLLTITDACQTARVSRRTLYRAIKSGALEASRRNGNGQWRITEDALAEWLGIRENDRTLRICWIGEE